MDLQRVPGVSPESKAALESAGVRSTADLARTSDVAALAERTGLQQARIEGMREAARARVVQLFRAAGVKDEAALAAGDAAELAERTGIPREDVEWFQAAARESLAGLPPTRVTLRPGRASATARVDGEPIDALPIRWDEKEPGEGDLVWLRPGLDKATARVRGATLVDVPIYAEREGGEVRVRVAALRAEEPKKEKRGLFGRRKG